MFMQHTVPYKRTVLTSKKAYSLEFSSQPKREVLSDEANQLLKAIAFISPKQFNDFGHRSSYESIHENALQFIPDYLIQNKLFTELNEQGLLSIQGQLPKELGAVIKNLALQGKKVTIKAKRTYFFQITKAGSQFLNEIGFLA